jgi:hypothetical protein
VRTIPSPAPRPAPAAAAGALASLPEPVPDGGTPAATAKGEALTTEGAQAMMQGRGRTAILSRSGSGRGGDVGADFADIRKAELRLFPDRLAVGITYAALPETLPFNGAGLEGNALEYEWACSIDLDGDGTPDYSLSLSSVKSPDAKPVKASILMRCAARLWKLDDSGGGIVDAEVEAVADGATLFFSLADGPGLPLKRITTATRFAATTYYDNGKDVIQDELDF